MALAAQTGIHYPLQSGNEWVYRITGATGNRTVVATVADQRGPWSMLQGLNPTTIPVRIGDTGELLVLDTAANREQPWTAAAGQCSEAASVEQGVYRGPI